MRNKKNSQVAPAQPVTTAVQGYEFVESTDLPVWELPGPDQQYYLLILGKTVRLAVYESDIVPAEWRAAISTYIGFEVLKGFDNLASAQAAALGRARELLAPIMADLNKLLAQPVKE